MRRVFTFIKYNAKLLAEREKLTSLEKSLIVRDTDPDVIHRFTPEEREVLAKLKAKYGDFKWIMRMWRLKAPIMQSE